MHNIFIIKDKSCLSHVPCAYSSSSNNRECSGGGDNKMDDGSWVAML